MPPREYDYRLFLLPRAPKPAAEWCEDQERPRCGPPRTGIPLSTWAVADVDKDFESPGNSNHGSKKIVVIPFDGLALRCRLWATTCRPLLAARAVRGPAAGGGAQAAPGPGVVPVAVALPAAVRPAGGSPGAQVRACRPPAAADRTPAERLRWAQACRIASGARRTAGRTRSLAAAGCGCHRRPEPCELEVVSEFVARPRARSACAREHRAGKCPEFPGGCEARFFGCKGPLASSPLLE